ncbi:GAF domain-containing protein [Spirillospora sp. NPDC127200]
MAGRRDAVPVPGRKRHRPPALSRSPLGTMASRPRGRPGFSRPTGRRLQNHQGPCPDAFTTGRPVHCADLAASAAARRWPLFVTEAVQCGFAAIGALPMRLADQVIGALNLFRAAPGELPEATVRQGQAFAALRDRARRHDRRLTDPAQAVTARTLDPAELAGLAGRGRSATGPPVTGPGRDEGPA